MSKRDYYEVLGVPKAATDAEIKRAYRKLAMEHHPDKHGGDDSKFKEIGEAYETLKDPQKKAAYDQFGHAGAQGNPFGGGGNPYGGGGQQQYSAGFEGFDFSDILNQFMGGSGGSQRGPQRGRDLEMSVTIEFKEAIFGTAKEVSMTLDDTCDHCNGKGAEPGTKLKTCATCNGQGQVTRVQNTILGSIRQQSVCATCKGRGQIPEKPCTICNGNGIHRREQTLSLKIPAGVDDRATMRVTGKGAAAQGGGPKGDLYVNIRVRGDKNFIRQGRDIVSEAKISMVHAALGTEIPVLTVDGDVKLKVPSGTQSGKVFKLSNRGVPGINGKSRGDHLVHITVETPARLSAKQRELLEEFQRDGGKKGFFK